MNDFKKMLVDRVKPGYTALLVIDMQNDFVHEKGAFRKYGFDTSMVTEAIEPMKRVLKAARTAKMLIIHVRMINDMDKNPPSWVAFWGKPSITLEGTWGAEFYGGFEPIKGEIILSKYTYGAFIGTNLETILKNHGIRSVIVVGTGPNICLGDTVHQAFALGYHIVVPEEAVATFSKKDKEFTSKVKEVALYIIENHYGIICSVNDLLYAWEIKK